VARTSSFALVIAVAAGLAASLGLSSVGCDGGGTPTLTGSGGGSSSSGGGNGQGGAFVDNGKELFSGIEQDLVDNCGTCHVPGGIADAPFLAEPDRYESILAWPGIVVANPDDSLFNTYAITGGGHSGTNLDSAPNDLQARVQEWLTAEAAAISAPPDTTKPHIDPVTPILGFNALYLTPLSTDLEGIAITFTAEELTPTSLKLSDITVHTTSAMGVHLVHPVFAVYPKGKDVDPDPVDSFADLDHKFPESSAELLGVGTLILTNWESEAKLGVAFEIAEPYNSMTGAGGGGGAGGGSTGGACSAQAEFDASAKPQFQNKCVGCHGGSNGSATAAVDMSQLGSNSSAACGQILNRVDPTDPPSSQIFVTTDPNGNAAHPFKFAGSTTDFNNFKNQVSTWIQAE
jgi:hypothetical protein